MFELSRLNRPFVFKPNQKRLTFIHAGAVESFGLPDGVPVLLILRLQNTCNNRITTGRFQKKKSHLRMKAELQMWWASCDL